MNGCTNNVSSDAMFGLFVDAKRISIGVAALFSIVAVSSTVEGA